MGALYSGTSVSGYNSNPPPDDGSTGSLNQLQWNRDIKGKIGDPLNTFASAASSALVTSFGKTLSGGSVVKTAVNYGASAADQGRNIVATASGITITTPDATSVLSPFVWCINNQSTGNITIAGFSAQTIDGSNTARLGAARGVILWTDGSNWFSNGLVQGNLPLTNPGFGFDAPINLQLNATVGSNLLTVAVKANDGTDPTTSNPVLIPFRDPTYANGDPQWVAITSALSINTNAVGATLGTANGVAFRLWVVCFNNAGTPVLGLFQSVTGGSTPTAIAALDETVAPATTGISAAATSAGVFYTPNGTTFSANAHAFRILGYVEYTSGLATAGTYASAPTRVQLFGPGIRKPSDILQSQNTLNVSGFNASSATFVNGSSLSITPTNPCNVIYAAFASGAQTSGSTTLTISLSRGTTNNTGLIGPTVAFGASIAGTFNGNFFVDAYDFPQTVSAQAYGIQAKASSGTDTVGAFTFKLQEIMV